MGGDLIEQHKRIPQFEYQLEIPITDNSADAKFNCRTTLNIAYHDDV